MATAFVRTVLGALSPLLRPGPCAAAPRALCTLLGGPLPAAGAAASLLRCRLLPGLPPALGFKTKGAIRKRCKDCYRVKRRGRWFIYCKANPKHKQRQM